MPTTRFWGSRTRRTSTSERRPKTHSEWDIPNDHVTWSDGLLHIHGLTPNQFEPTREGAGNRVYADDQELVRQTVERGVAERQPIALDYRIAHSDGRLRTLRSRADVIVDDAGEPIRLVGIVHDITDAKLAQEALQNTSADLERRAIELQTLALQTTAEPPVKAHTPLTPRELDILRLVAQGLTNAAIAERLFVTEGTVKWHIKQILAKTGASNRAEAVARVLGATR